MYFRENLPGASGSAMLEVSLLSDALEFKYDFNG